MATTLAHWLLAALALPALASCLYLLVLTLLSGRLPVPPRSSRLLRFDVMIPAHNESAVIERCLASLKKLDWPPDRFRLWVIADNCTDGTAMLAQAAGAQVLERSDPTQRSKGYALRFAFDQSLKSGWADAVAVVDADAGVSTNLLEAFAARIESGAGAIQAHYGVLNPAESWRTGLIAIAHGAFHGVRSRARERLSLSSGLRGNGWCVTHRVLREVPYRAFSMTEDLEYGIHLGLAGCRVHYAGEASADATMESGENIARKQRQRWESGRFDLIRSQTVPLLLAALRNARHEPGPPSLLNTDVRRRSRICLDLAFDLLVLPLSYIVLNVAALIAAAAAASLWQPTLGIWLWPGAIATACLMLYVLRGWQLSGRGAAGLVDLLRAPFFILWRMWLLLRRQGRREWVPTERRNR